ncbi:GIY-YIG nuclease family protein [Mesomycoplasma conjunctivae]|uniref:GIY-YIG nuclease family protein n=1 Tax=Mesomycoplasma conjunctivae TaxID=45361 RepID=UPI003DA2AB80
MTRFKQLVSKINLPKQAGVYRFYDDQKRLLYVGKSKNIYERIHQYATGSINSYKTGKLLQETVDIQYTIVANETEALVLEKRLIGLYQPKYNIELKDDKGYPYIQIRKDNKLISIDIVYKIKRGHKYFSYGPFLKRSAAFEIKKLLESELLYEKGAKITFENQEQVDDAFNLSKDILQKRKWINYYEQKMNFAIENMQYEIAQKYFESITVLKQMAHQYQNVDLNSDENLDFMYFDSVGKNNLVITFLFYRNGYMLSHRTFFVDILFSLENTITSFVNNYYKNNFLPQYVFVTEESSRFFENHLDFHIPIKIAKSKSHLQILENAKINNNDFIKKDLRIKLEQENNLNNILKQMRYELNLEKNDIILLIDNSHIANQLPTTGVIYFLNGLHSKKYNRFFNYTGNKKGDVDYLEQGLKKHFSVKNALIPDVIFVDGGIAQINTVETILLAKSLKIPLFGLVKNSRHKTDHILDKFGNKLKISQNVFNLIANMQEEVDIFSKSKLRNKIIKKILTQ